VRQLGIYSNSNIKNYKSLEGHTPRFCAFIRKDVELQFIIFLYWHWQYRKRHNNSLAWQSREFQWGNVFRAKFQGAFPDQRELGLCGSFTFKDL